MRRPHDDRPLIAAVLTATAVLLVDLGVGPAARLPPSGPPSSVWRSRPSDVPGRDETTTAFAGSYKVDALTTFLDVLFISIVAMTVVFAPDYLLPRGLPIAEFARSWSSR